MALKYTKEALKEMVKNFDTPVPVYDSDDPQTRKRIGDVISLEYTNNDDVEILSKLYDGKMVKSKWV